MAVRVRGHTGRAHGLEGDAAVVGDGFGGGAEPGRVDRVHRHHCRAAPVVSSPVGTQPRSHADRAPLMVVGRVALYALLIAAALGVLLPFYWMVVSSLKTNNEVFSVPITLWSLIIMQAFGAFGVFLMKQFYDTIPEELSEAARLDGLSEYGIWWRIMMPLSVPAIASLVLLVFVNTWNDYLGPLIYLRDPQLWTIQLGLRTFISQDNADYALIMTGAVLSVLPIVVVFLLGQRYFIEGIASTGLKG